MKAVLVIELEDDVNLNDIEIRYAIQDKYGMPVKAEVDGCPLRPLPDKQKNRPQTGGYTRGFTAGFNKYRYLITGETE